MKNLKLIFAFVLFTAFISMQDSKAQVYYMVEDYVKPSMISQYELALKDYMDYMSVNNFAFPVQIFESRDLHFYYITPIRSTYADADSINVAYNKVASKDPEKWDEMFAKFNDTYNYSKTSFYYYADNLSYIPEVQILPDEEMMYQEVWFCQVKLGKADELNSLFKEYNALCKKNGVGYPIYVYRGLIGMDQGTYMISYPAKDPADCWESQNKTMELIGEEGARIESLMMELFDKIEVKLIWWSKKYSYTPKK